MSNAYDPDVTPDSAVVNHSVLDPTNTEVFPLDANPPALTVSTPHDTLGDTDATG